MMLSRSHFVLSAAVAFAVCACDGSAKPSKDQAAAASSARTSGSGKHGAGEGKDRRDKGKDGSQRNKGKRNGGDGSARAEGEEHVIKLRFHLLKAPGSDWLDSGVDQKKVEAWIAGTNEAWKQANIRFELEKVLTEDAIEPAKHDEAVERFMKLKKKGKKKGDKTSKKDKKSWSKDLQEAKREQTAARVNAIPQGQRIEKGIDIFVVGKLPAAGGVFGCPLRGVLYAARRKGTDDGLNIAKVLAHELGHALGLPHSECADDQNIMMEGGCKHRKPENIALNDEQIAIARKIAATGEARVCKKGEKDIDD